MAKFGKYPVRIFGVDRFWLPVMKKVFDFLRLFVFLAVLAVGSAYLANYSSESVMGRAKVIDGDSLQLDGREIRLSGIDAPEYRQLCSDSITGDTSYPCGKEAARHLRSLIGGNSVQCSGSATDKYDRFLAVCEVAGSELNQAMVSDGWAVAFGAYEGDEDKAKAAKKGLWRGEFSLPADWRRSRAEKHHSNWLANLFD